MHSHNLYELIFFKKGDAYQIIEDRKYQLAKNDLILMRPLKYHYIEVESNNEYERYDFLFNADLFGFNDIDGFKNFPEVINLSGNQIAKDIFSKLNYYHNKLNETEFKTVAILLLKELFYNLSITSVTEEKEYSTLTPILSSALKYINENLFTLENVNEVAEKLYVTPSYLFRLFKQELKNTPKKYLTDKRLLIAQSMIILGKQPTRVANECGWNDYTAFYRSYVKFFGYPPSKEVKKT
jgi:AraC-like DNA-binding protein